MPTSDIVIAKAQQVGLAPTSEEQGGMLAPRLPIQLKHINERNFGSVLEFVGYDLRFNRLSQKIEFRKGGSDDHSEWRHLEPKEHRIMWRRIITACAPGGGTRMPHDDALAIMETYLRDNLLEINPFWDWVSELPEEDGSHLRPIADLWDVPLLKGIDPAIQDAYISKMEWMPFVAAVANMVSPTPPGYRVAPVLISDQHAGKSTWLKSTLPTRMRREWASRLKFRSEVKEMVPQCAGAVFVEVAEKVGLTSQQREEAKAFLDDPHPSYRQNYDRERTTFNRNWFIYITTNQTQALPFDVSGNSRYGVVKLGVPEGWRDDPKVKELCLKYWDTETPAYYGLYVSAWMTEHLAGIWSHARKLYAEHGDRFLEISPTEEITQIAMAEKHTKSSEVDDRVRDLLHADGSEDFGVVSACAPIHIARVIGSADMTDKLVGGKDMAYIEREMERLGFAKLTREDIGKDPRLNFKALQSVADARASLDGATWIRSKSVVWFHPKRATAELALEGAKRFGEKVDDYLCPALDLDPPPKATETGQDKFW